MMKSRKHGFTLAETLITLGIIGLVAAIALPTLFDAWDDRKIESAKKKAMYTLANGYKKLATDAEVSMSNSPLFKCGKKFDCLSQWHRKAFSLAADQSLSHNGLPETYVRSDSDEEEAAFSWDDVPYIFRTADGMTFGYISGTKEGGIEVAVDINGEGQPNKICEDVFKIVIDNKGGVTETYKEGDETKSLCSKLNNSLKSCTVEDIDNENVCDAAGRKQLYDNGNIQSNGSFSYGGLDIVYTEGDVYYGKLVCKGNNAFIIEMDNYNVVPLGTYNDYKKRPYCE